MVFDFPIQDVFDSETASLPVIRRGRQCLVRSDESVISLL